MKNTTAPALTLATHEMVCTSARCTPNMATYSSKSHVIAMAIFVNGRLRRSIYSTNLIESVNKQLKKYTKRKEQFPNEASLERFLARCHLGFDQARAELEAMFDC